MLIAEQRDMSLDVNPLSMQLQGVLDAAVMGGTEKYRLVDWHVQVCHKNPKLLSLTLLVCPL